MQDTFIVGYRVTGDIAVTIDGSKENAVLASLTGNLELDAINLKRGVVYTLVCEQDGVGGNAIDFAPLEARYGKVLRSSAVIAAAGNAITVLHITLLSSTVVAVMQGAT